MLKGCAGAVDEAMGVLEASGENKKKIDSEDMDVLNEKIVARVVGAYFSSF